MPLSSLVPPVLQEAVSTGDPEMVQLVLQYRDYQRATQRLAGIPELLNKLRQAPDFYVEMKWEFTSWGEWAPLSSQGPGVGPLGKHPSDFCTPFSAPCVQDVPERRVPRVEAG